MFVNYFANDRRPSPVNLAAGRLVLGFWLIWKTIWYDWSQHVNIPYMAVTSSGDWAIPTSVPWILTFEKWVLIALLCLFIFGYKIRITAATSSLILAHLGTVRRTLVGSGETGTLFIGVFFLLFSALYAETDELSVDGIRRRADVPVERASELLRSTSDRQFRMPSLRYSLLTIAVLYFSSGVSKIIEGGGLGFISKSNLTRLVLVHSYAYPWHDFQTIIIEYPILSVLGGSMTLVLEIGFLLAVLFGVGFTPFMIGLLGFVFSNVVFLGIFFADNLFLLMLFFAYDETYAHLVPDRQLTVVFDGRCSFCVSVLYPFKLLDVNKSITFVPQRDAPDTYRDRCDVEFDRFMYTFDQGTTYEGYEAFRELLRQFRIFFVLVRVMGFPAIERIGRRTYRYVADNRSRRFECSAEE